jgi:hypothetical protein
MVRVMSSVVEVEMDMGSMMDDVLCSIAVCGTVVSIKVWLYIMGMLDNKEIAPVCFLIGVVLGPLKMYIPWLAGPKMVVDMARIVSAGVTGQVQYIS